MSLPWPETEREYVRANAGILKDREIATNLTRITGRFVSHVSVKRQRQKMGLRKKSGRGVCRLDEGAAILSSKARGLS